MKCRTTFDFGTWCWRTIFAIVSLTLLTGCLHSVSPKPNPRLNDAAGEALCDAWLGSLATWADADTEQTKDEVDKAIRVQEAACLEVKP